MLGRSMIGKVLPQCFDRYLWCAGHLGDRPICEDCFKPRERPIQPAAIRKDTHMRPAHSGGWDNMVRAMEDG